MRWSSVGQGFRRNEKGAFHDHHHYFEQNDKKVRDKYKVDQDYSPLPLQRQIFANNFKIIEKNLYHKGFLETYEGILISLNKLTLNVQVPHECMTFLDTSTIVNTSVTKHTS